jgi:hypothetical protein
MHARPECEIYVIDPQKPKIPFTRPIHFIEEKATTGMEIFAHDIGFLTAK